MRSGHWRTCNKVLVRGNVQVDLCNTCMCAIISYIRYHPTDVLYMKFITCVCLVRFGKDYTIGTLHYNWISRAHVCAFVTGLQHVQCTDSVIMPRCPQFYMTVTDWCYCRHVMRGLCVFSRREHVLRLLFLLMFSLIINHCLVANTVITTWNKQWNAWWTDECGSC